MPLKNQMAHEIKKPWSKAPMAIPPRYRDDWLWVPVMIIKEEKPTVPFHGSPLLYRLAPYNIFYPSMSRKNFFLLGLTSRVMTGFFSSGAGEMRLQNGMEEGTEGKSF
jgi:hypothetical protein